MTKQTCKAPFLLNDDNAYQQWRDKKLKQAHNNPSHNITIIQNPLQPSKAELEQITQQCQQYNMAIYRFEHGTIKDKTLIKEAVHGLAQALHLTRMDANLYADEDALSAITVSIKPQQRDFIPYTDKPLNWHTDGYYNTPDHLIQSFLLHCVQPAKQGGETQLLDPELVYIALRDHNPEYIRALSASDVLSIPENRLNGQLLRAEQSGAVFSCLPCGHLHTRYTARTRSIAWKTDPQVEQALTMIGELLNESPYCIRHTLQSGEGIINNNVLHNRSAFTDERTNPRLLYRGRYYQRVGSKHTTKA